MSHFSTIKTKLKDKDVLIKALNTLSYSAQENVLLTNPDDHDHRQWNVEVGITRYVGFKRSQDGTLELVAELDAWEESIPIERFLQKVTQAYAREMLVETVQEKGYTVVSEQKSVDNTIELVVEKW
tara:strand:- start:627 stop:1004 length:378 start_codon:yes stop_codon:yes gene_type:complete